MTVSLDPDKYKPTSPMKGVWLFLVSGTRYVEAAIEHGAWVNLQAADLRASYLQGNFVPGAPEFQSEEKKRFECAGMRTRLPVQSFYDPEGKYHVHDGNTTTTSYNCTNGHNWWESTRGSCWCGWPTEESS